MEMVEVKTSDLEGAALGWAVAITGAVTVEQNGLDFDARGRPTVGGYMNIPYEPSKNWAQGGTLIEKYQIEFSICEDTGSVGASLLAWRSFGKSHRTRWSKGGAHLIAACRAIVAAKLGDVVSVPAEVLKPR